MRVVVSLLFICVFQNAVSAHDQHEVQASSSFSSDLKKDQMKEGPKKIYFSTLVYKIYSIINCLFKNEHIENKHDDSTNDEANHTSLISVDNSNSGANNESVIEGIIRSNEKNKTNVIISNKSSDKSNEMVNIICTENNEHYPIPGSCDSYIRCQNGKKEVKQCPNGLRYNRNVKSNEYPCQYPPDVKCPPGSSLQPPKPNDVCPYRFGYFKTVDRFNCSSYRICENGIGYDHTCPSGLAFSSSTYRCEFPDRVPQCNVEAYLDYRCPEMPPGLKNIDVPRGYTSSADCNIYYSCMNNKPRRLQCDEYFAFDEGTQSCIPAHFVTTCTEKQKIIAFSVVRRKANGEYVVRSRGDRYDLTRDQPIIFVEFKDRPKVIL